MAGHKFLERNAVSPAADGHLSPKPGVPDRIFVRDYVLPCAIGAYEEEKGVTQKVGFTVEAVVATENARIHDDLANVPSYDDIIKVIEATVREGHINLVETYAERIAGRCLQDPRLAEVRVRVEKLERGPAGVGIEIVRQRTR